MRLTSSYPKKDRITTQWREGTLEKEEVMEQTDEDLVKSYYQGNEEALEMLFARYKMPILNFSLRILNGRADAEDVTSEVFLSLFAKKYAPKQGVRFSTWLFTVARNACLTQKRKQKKMFGMWFTKKESSTYEEWNIPDKADLPNEVLSKKEEALKVKQAIQNLPELQKEILILREYHFFKYAQISEIVGCSLEQVKINIFRARENLRGVLMGEHHE